MCPCGKPLHYPDVRLRCQVERLIEELGPEARVKRGKRAWIVPRHYIALHGVREEAELVRLGFKEVPQR